MLDAFVKSGFDVFAGSEVFLLDNMRSGGVAASRRRATSIRGDQQAVRGLARPERGRASEGLTAPRIMQKYPMMAALKAVIAHSARTGLGDGPASARRACARPEQGADRRARSAIFRDAGLAAPAVATA